MILNVKKLVENAILPAYGSSYAAGIDVCSTSAHSIPPRSRKLVGTGLSISWTSGSGSSTSGSGSSTSGSGSSTSGSSSGSSQNPEDFYIRVAPRSGLAAKQSIDVGAGVIDYDYRGEVFVLLINHHNENTYEVKSGEKIAQLIMERIKRPSILEVDQHSETERGAGGFGSTDKPKVA
jgi:dUTP pyrophosphatase